MPESTLSFWSLTFGLGTTVQPQAGAANEEEQTAGPSNEAAANRAHAKRGRKLVMSMTPFTSQQRRAAPWVPWQHRSCASGSLAQRQAATIATENSGCRV